MEEVARRVRVTGRVQGVGFRAWTAGEARHRGLRGWVRNETDGSVSALICGEARAVEDMLRALRSGPAAGDVAEVAAEAAEPPDVAGFSVR
jgi:acylphosphatase